MTAHPEYKNIAGVPTGGIGACKIERGPDGGIRNLTVQNNLDMLLTRILQ